MPVPCAPAALYQRASREAERAAPAQGGCIIRANFLDDIKKAYERDPALTNLLMDPFFAKAAAEHQGAWRRVITQVRARPPATPALPAQPPSLRSASSRSQVLTMP